MSISGIACDFTPHSSCRQKRPPVHEDHGGSVIIQEWELDSWKSSDVARSRRPDHPHRRIAGGLLLVVNKRLLAAARAKSLVQVTVVCLVSAPRTHWAPPPARTSSQECGRVNAKMANVRLV